MGVPCMKIGVVTETYPPETNGVALTIRKLVEGLSERGHEVHLTRPRQAHEAGVPDRRDIQLVPGLGIPGYPGLKFGLPAGRRLRRAWRSWRPETVYVATEGPLGISAMRCARRLGIPAVTGFHTRFDHYARHYRAGWFTPLVRRHLRRFHQRAQATLVPTEQLARELETLGIDNARLFKRTVDTARFAPEHRDAGLRAQWGASDDTPVLLYVGRIAPEKNLQLAVRAYQAMRRHCPALRYVWVGDGPAREALQRSHPEFLFAGMRHGEDLARCYASADLFVFPSRSETFGNVILEALASGLPAVAFDSGAARQLLRDGHNGFAVADGDEAAFLDACVKLVADGRYRDMRTNARSSMQQFEPGAMLADFERILLEASAHPRPDAAAGRSGQHSEFTGQAGKQGVRP